MIEYDKLVRDKIPQIIEASGKKAVVKQAGDDYQDYLKKKLQEEVDEYLESDDPGELADILEVIKALGSAHGISLETILEMAQGKREARGGFEEGIVLVSIE